MNDGYLELARPTAFFRLCGSVVRDKQCREFAWNPNGLPEPDVTLLDLTTANIMIQAWQKVSFGNRRRLLRAIQKRGPAAAVNAVFKAIR